ncbi:hypothetical protein BLA60_27130 [Actinophytocola xinjiangensis]|uniref:Uncharacterized protein n=1 Tax=Actinophytocola xinjiangensis TaxID=485602 RepID=A0A7Z0WIU2_9PSEU|nr:hypothetical protein BLA60_27130 [Actinophytocola xinjiangensis]
MAYAAAGLFLVAGVLALVIAIVGWNGTSDNVDMLVALVGAAFSEEFTGNLDFAISVTMSVACSSLSLGLVLLARVDVVRWLLAFVGALTSVYYLYAVIKLLADGGGEYIAMVLVSLLLWIAATVVVVLPGTGRAMRGYQRRLAQYGQPPGYPQGYPQGGYRPY